MKNSLPANAATNVSKTPTLSWTPVSSANIYMVALIRPGLTYLFVMPVSSSSLKIPDYTGLGLPLATSTIYNWTVSAVRSSGLSMDFVTDPCNGWNEYTDHVSGFKFGPLHVQQHDLHYCALRPHNEIRRGQTRESGYRTSYPLRKG